MTKEQAIKLNDSKWYEGKSDYDICKFQLFESKLCMPFSIFHEALENCLKRPVYTHELGLNLDGIKKEFLGEKPAPTLQERIDIIPKEKQIIIIADQPS